MAIDLIDARRATAARVASAARTCSTSQRARSTRSLARATVLATGGAGKVYLYTTNPDVATGDGVAMAYRAGAEIANMEFFQFHPTCLFHPQAKSFLISEALRGEGGVLRLADGTPFMEAPPRAGGSRAARRRRARHRLRDEAQRRRARLLDMTRNRPHYLRRALPEHPRRVHALRHRHDARADPGRAGGALHVRRRARSISSGRTSMPGLWAIGEIACTGLHGANRLASQLAARGARVRPPRGARAARRSASTNTASEPPDWDMGEAAPSDEAVVVTHNWDELRRCMWNYVGIVRSDKRLRRAARRIALLEGGDPRVLLEAPRHARSARAAQHRRPGRADRRAARGSRKESRGLHYTLDYPTLDDAAFHGEVVLSRDEESRLVGIARL